MIEVELRKLPSDMSLLIELHLTREFRIRKWIAVNLIKLAAIILGCGIEGKE
jgi:hypothetical protein